MSEVADSIIREYLSEQNERLDNDSTILRVETFFSYIGGMFGLLSKVFKMFLINFVLLFFAFFLILDVSIIQELKSATPDDIMKTKELFLIFFWVINFISALLMTFVYFGRYKSIKTERVEQDEKAATEAYKIVLLAEEVLRRHNLIEKV